MRTVLIIDSDGDFRRQAYRWSLAAGWRPLEAEDGEQGLAQVLLMQPEVILCDMHIPRVNGFQLCRNVRQQRTRIRQPIIIATGSSSYASDRQSALDAGADRYVVKPLEEADLGRLLDGQAEVEEAPAPAPSTPAGGAGFLPALQDREPPFVRFWGVRGSIPSPGPGTVNYGGNTSCVELRADGEIVILDAGSGIRGLGLALAREFKEQPISVTILITHTHWDHIQGFPFFVPAYNPRNQVRIIG